MSLKWIAENLSLGGILQNIGGAAGTVVKVGFETVAVVTEIAADAAGAENSKKYSSAIKTFGNIADTALTTTGEIAGLAANTVTEYAGKAGGGIAALGAGLAGGDVNSVEKARLVGTIAGSAAVGAVAGMGIAQTAVELAAATGTVGAAATSSGLATIGGGSLAAGGGGMATGQAITSSIVAASSVSAGLTGVSSSQVHDENKRLIKP